MITIKKLFWILLLANLALWSYGQRARWTEPETTLKPELNANQITLLDAVALETYPARSASPPVPETVYPTPDNQPPATTVPSATNSERAVSQAEGNARATQDVPKMDVPKLDAPKQEPPAKEAQPKPASPKEPVAKEAATKLASAASNKSESDPVAATRKTETAKDNTPQANTACYEWSGFSFPRATEAVSLAQQLNIQSQTNLVSSPQIGVRYWVYKPPLASAEAAQNKADELRKLGVEDFFIVQDDPKWRHAISFGIFRDEKLADKLMADLKAKGVRALTKAPRTGGQAVIKLQHVSPQQYAEVRKSLARFPDTVLKEIDCQ